MEPLKALEALSHERLTQTRRLAALSAEALGHLDEENSEAFADNIEAGNAVIAQIDRLSAAMEEGVGRLNGKDAAIVRALLQSGEADIRCPDWCAQLLSDHIALVRLLRDCQSLNARMESGARVISENAQHHLNGIRMNRKIVKRYAAPGPTSGTRINV
ncbi:hypothetical protein ACH6CV_04435 [Bacillota bacterium Meth-B3]